MQNDITRVQCMKCAQVVNVRGFGRHFHRADHESLSTTKYDPMIRMMNYRYQQDLFAQIKKSYVFGRYLDRARYLDRSFDNAKATIYFKYKEL